MEFNSTCSYSFNSLSNRGKIGTSLRIEGSENTFGKQEEASIRNIFPKFCHLYLNKAWGEKYLDTGNSPKTFLVIWPLPTGNDFKGIKLLVKFLRKM